MQIKKILKNLLFIAGFFLIQTVSAQTYPDVPSSHPYYSAIENLSAQGVIQGNPDGNFRPDDPINRVETLKILLLSLKEEIANTTSNAGFPDIVSNSWYGKYVVAAKEKGIIKGHPDGYFYPGNQVNFAEALKIICVSYQLNLPTTVDMNPFVDVPKDSWYAPYFQYAKENGILQQPSPSTQIYPGKLLTRGELAALIYNFQNKDAAQTESLTGMATYYADQFQGQTTASGEIFDQNKYTAAHKTLPFGTRVKVTNLNTQKAVIVTINDRGPYGKSNYILDLSSSAFEAISPLSAGVIPVQYEIVFSAETETTATNDLTNCSQINVERETIKTDFFQNITLSEEVPTLFQKDEVYLFSGTASGTENQAITAFLLNPDTHATVMYFKTTLNSQKQFSLPVNFSESGKFNLGLIIGDIGSSYVETITVIPTEDCNPSNNPPAVPSNLRVEFQNDQTTFRWDNPGCQLSQLKISQGNQNKIYLLNNQQNSFTVPYQDFTNFTEDSVTYSVSCATSSSTFSVDRNSNWLSSSAKSFVATKHYQNLNNLDLITLEETPDYYILNQEINLQGKAQEEIKTQASLILPDGQVKDIDLNADKIITQTEKNTQVIPAETNFTFSFTPTQKGTYILEINSTEGFALINYPLYQKGVIPLLPDMWDQKDPFIDPLQVNAQIDLKALQNELLAKINQDRQIFGLNTLVLDSNISQLAQSRANDMDTRNYFSHQNPDGQYAQDLKSPYGIKTHITENIAKDISVEFGHTGLMRSAIHRENILNPRWTRVGLGIAVDTEGYLLVVEIFSTNELEKKDFNAMKNELVSEINKKRNQSLNINNTLAQLAQNWSDTLIDNPNAWFEDNQTGMSLSFLISKDYPNIQTASTILKGDYEAILKKITENTSLLETQWEKIGVGISQNKDATLNITILYSE